MDLTEAALLELIKGLDLAVTNARDHETLLVLIGDATTRALAVYQGEIPPSHLTIV